jgi:hypothetical protein
MHNLLTKGNDAAFANRGLRQTATPAIPAGSLRDNIAAPMLSDMMGLVKTYAEMTAYEQQRVFHHCEEIAGMMIPGPTGWWVCGTPFHNYWYGEAGSHRPMARERSIEVFDATVRGAAWLALAGSVQQLIKGNQAVV